MNGLQLHLLVLLINVNELLSDGFLTGVGAVGTPAPLLPAVMDANETEIMSQTNVIALRSVKVCNILILFPVWSKTYRRISNSTYCLHVHDAYLVCPTCEHHRNGVTCALKCKCSTNVHVSECLDQI